MTPLIGISTGVVEFTLGMWIGWRLTRPSSGEVTAGWREMWRYGPSPLYRTNPKNLRVAVSAFGGAFSAIGISVLADYIHSTWLAFIAFGVMALSVGIGWGAIWFYRPLKNG